MSKNIALTIIQPGFEILTPTDGMMEHLELCGRTCYKSEERICEGSASRFVRMICKNHHESVLEHCSIGVRIIGSRAMSHQLVRHRIAAYSQESMRYVNYSKRAARSSECPSLAVVCPPRIGLPPGDYISHHLFEWYRQETDGNYSLVDPQIHVDWLTTVGLTYDTYCAEIDAGVPPEDARYLLPNASKTEVATTYNLRTWRHVFGQRCTTHAQWEIRSIMLGILQEFSVRLPDVFGDLATKFLTPANS